ncbi:extracellular solute-binding protein [Chloroflexi bacterium TSY]|nr:extracellular solute-binding protein [Chloroflexi bacterium TSY]
MIHFPLLIPKIIIPILMLLCLTACFGSAVRDSGGRLSNDLRGQLLIWHTWEGEERETLQGIFGDFTDLYPNVNLVEEFYPLDTIEETFQYQVEAGLGPDLFVAPATWVNQLASQGLIQEIDQEDEVDLDIYLSAALDMLRQEETVYGLPLSLNTFTLYYNKTLLEETQAPESSSDVFTSLIQAKQSTITDTVTLAALDDLVTEVESSQSAVEVFTPPTDLDDLLRQINLGKTVAIRTDFYGAFWGIQAFGGQLFDEEGRVILNQGGYANWLGWLQQAQENPNVILNRNADELASLFTSGQVTYYVGSTQELPTLQAALGEEVVGVVRLPGSSNNPAGPFLQAEALLFNRASTKQSQYLALQLAQYLTNREQQRKLALAVGKLPANNRVNIDPRVNSLVAEFIAQSRTAVPVSLPNIQVFHDLTDYGDDINGQALDGQIGLGEAATSLTEEINARYGHETLAASQTTDCDVQGKVTMWNTWTRARQSILNQIGDKFTQLCPGATVAIIDVDPAEFQDRYRAAIEADDVPALFTRNNRRLTQLASEELILNLSTLLADDFQQRFSPLVDQSMSYEGNLYGIPVSLNTMALYYNSDLAGDPPVVFDDLLIAATPDTQVALPIGFFASYWGISAFGESSESPLFDEEGRLIVGEAGLADWLAWLKAAQIQPGFAFSTDPDEFELQTLFKEGQAAYLVADVSHLSDLQAALGRDKVGVRPLPLGSPLLLVDGVFLSPFASEEEQTVALQFAQFLTDVKNQTLLLEQAQLIPTNVNVSTADNPAIEGFLQQASAATVIPNRAEMQAVFEWGDLVYDEVLINDIDPPAAVQKFTELVDATHGFEIVAEAEQPCTEEGTVSLWHSWSETEAVAWQQVITNFIGVCPGIQITPLFVEAAEFTEQLSSTLEAETDLTLPDLFLASQTQLETYEANLLIQDITDLFGQDQQSDFFPKAVHSLTVGDQIYGIPQALHVPALYYNVDQVDTPASTFENLLLQAQEGLTVAVNADFYEVLWGAAAFGCHPCQTGEFFNEQGELTLSEADLADWRAWLAEAAETDHFIFSRDQKELEKMFLAGEVAYLVAGPSFLNEAQAALGVAHVGVTSLPVGEAEHISRPFLGVDSFFFHQETTEEQTLLALRFVTFATNEASQTLLMQTANLVPTNILTLVTVDDPALSAFIHEVETSMPWPRQRELSVIEEDDVFHSFDDLIDNQ